MHKAEQYPCTIKDLSIYDHHMIKLFPVINKKYQGNDYCIERRGVSRRLYYNTFSTNVPLTDKPGSWFLPAE